MNLEWNVFYYDFNAKEIKVSNVFRHGRYKEEVEEFVLRNNLATNNI